jgi:hypothetical protein
VQENWIPKGRLQRKKIPRAKTISNGLSEFLAFEHAENQNQLSLWDVYCPRKSGRVLSKDVTYAVYELKDVGAFLFRAARRAAEHLLATRERVDKPLIPVLLRKINSDVRKAEEQRLLGEHISKVM